MNAQDRNPKKLITTDRQLAWWITHMRRKWREDDQLIWQVQVNTGHWSSLWLSQDMLRSLQTHRQISHKYLARILGPYADLPRRLQVQVTSRPTRKEE